MNKLKTISPIGIGTTIQWCLNPNEEDLYKQGWYTDVVTGENKYLYYTKRGKRFSKVNLKMFGSGPQVHVGSDKYDAWHEQFKLEHVKSQCLNSFKDHFGVVCTGYTAKFGVEQCKELVKVMQELGYEFDYLEVLS